MGDFETNPVGTNQRLAELEARPVIVEVKVRRGSLVFVASREGLRNLPDGSYQLVLKHDPEPLAVPAV